MNNVLNYWLNQLLKEWLFVASATGLAATSIYLQRLPSYNIQDIEIVYILFVLFVTIKGLEKSGFFASIAPLLENKKWLPFHLIVITMVLSMFVTNDVALLLIVPLTLKLNTNRRDLLVILETLAANAGSALTPFGNPQNLFIYWFYHLHPLEFIKVIVPFSVCFFVLLSIGSFFIKTEILPNHESKKPLFKKVFLYLSFLIMFILSILKILPLTVGLFIIAFVLIFDRKCLKIDYILLGTFFCFFGFTDNMIQIIKITIENPSQVFLLSAIFSQFISNVPSALLFSDFTHNWRALLWGVNVGGFGNLIGSLANLIAYRFIILDQRESKSFVLKFHILGYIAFLLGCLLYFIIGKSILSHYHFYQK